MAEQGKKIVILGCALYLFAFRPLATSTMTTTTTTTTACARSGILRDRVGISRNQCTITKERMTFLRNGINKKWGGAA